MGILGPHHTQAIHGMLQQEGNFCTCSHKFQMQITVAQELRNLQCGLMLTEECAVLESSSAHGYPTGQSVPSMSRQERDSDET